MSWYCPIQPQGHLTSYRDTTIAIGNKERKRSVSSQGKSYKKLSLQSHRPLKLLDHGWKTNHKAYSQTPRTLCWFDHRAQEFMWSMQPLPGGGNEVTKGWASLSTAKTAGVSREGCDCGEKNVCVSVCVSEKERERERESILGWTRYLTTETDQLVRPICPPSVKYKDSLVNL